MVFHMSSAPNPQSDADQLEAATDQAIAAGGGDAREAVKALIVANHSAMFEKSSSTDNLAKALADYKADFEKRMKAAPNPDAAQAKEIVRQAEELVRRSGLGKALTDLLEDTKYCPSWSQREDFQKNVGFPASKIQARKDEKPDRLGRKTTTTVYFTYRDCRYGMIFNDEGSTTMPDGDLLHSGTVEFVADDKVVLGLNISLEGDDYREWHWFQVYALRIGDWTKHLLEIAVHIKNTHEASSEQYNENALLARAKNISL